MRSMRTSVSRSRGVSSISRTKGSRSGATAAIFLGDARLADGVPSARDALPRVIPTHGTLNRRRTVGNRGVPTAANSGNERRGKVARRKVLLTLRGRDFFVGRVSDPSKTLDF